MIRTTRIFPFVALALFFTPPAAAAQMASGEPVFVLAKPHAQAGSPDFRIETVSTRNDMVTGGDVLVRIDLPVGVTQSGIVVERNGSEVTTAFRPTAKDHLLIGFVQGLAVGENELVVRDRNGGGRRASLALTNHPIEGPVISGRHQQPFYCTTHLFQLVTGERLGPALDGNCSARTRLDYVYRSTTGRMLPLTDLSSRPADLVYTTTTEGNKVPYIVRVETGTINRAIYEIAVLHDPMQPAPNPWIPSQTWNGRLIYRFGGGCRQGWYTQGGATGGVLDDVQLSRGYATASATLNVFGNNCSDLLAAETMMMVKERFIEAYGRPRYTIGWGSSGGAHQQHGIGDNYPGLLDGLVVGQSFPDVTSTIFKLFDSRLLEHYFGEIAAGAFTQEQQRAISGFGVWASIANQSEGAHRIDPAAEFQQVVPEEARYHPQTNPRGARGSVYDHTVNVYGRDPATGFARRAIDNVGIQYGLAALNDGAISADQFLDLNERIGGLDANGRYQTARTEGDLAAIRAAYQTGRLTRGGGLASAPIIDYRPYVDFAEQGDNHMRVHSFSMRERLVRANGHADNHVILTRDSRFGTGFGGFSSAPPNEVLYDALAQMDRWLLNIASDSSSDPLPAKVVRSRPSEMVDACWTGQGEKISEPQAYGRPGRCNDIYAPFPLPRMIAGGPLTDDIVKCQLKPIDVSDYRTAFTTEQRARLDQIFSAGVCDWSRPGVEQQPQLGTWIRVLAQ